MNLSTLLLPEYDQEMATTRRTLERVPEDKLGWKPHEKSMLLGMLANHLVDTAGWTRMTMTTDELDFAPANGEGYKMPELTSRSEMLALFDKHVAEGREVLASASDENLMANWTLKGGGQEYFTMPRIGVIRTWVMNHMIHHRAQLGVYLRLNNIPVPGCYGPSADEQGVAAGG